MTTGRVSLPSKGRRKGHDLKENGPTLTMLADQRLHEKYRAAVIGKIGLREGNNLDILEALGLIPTVHTPKAEKPGRWPHAAVSA